MAPYRMSMAEAMKAIKPRREDYMDAAEHAAALRMWVDCCLTIYDTVTHPSRQQVSERLEFLEACGYGQHQED